MKNIPLLLIKFYQKYLTILSFGSCRYHPTCSSYAKTQFENNTFFKALYLSTVRILRCNPFYKGGFDYPKIKCFTNNTLNLEFKRIKIKYWKVPVQNNYCLILKHNTIWDK